MKRSVQVIPRLGRTLLAGTAAASFVLAPSIGFAGNSGIELAQATPAPAGPDTGPESKKRDGKHAPKQTGPTHAPPKARTAPPAVGKPVGTSTGKSDKPAGPSKAAQPPTKPAPKATAPQQPAPPPAAQRRTPEQSGAGKPEQKTPATAAERNKPEQKSGQQPEQKAAPNSASEKPGSAPARPPAPASAQQKDAADTKAAGRKAPEAIAPPAGPRSSGEFIRKEGEKASAGLDEVKRQRREVREGDRTVIREPDRTIVREGRRTIIRHDEASRFAIDARGVHVERKGDTTTTIVTRPNGVRIVTTTDARGHLLRRVRQMPDGKSIVIIDNTFAGAPRGNYFVDVPPPRFQGPRDRYIIDAGRAGRDRIEEVFVARPVAPLERRYTLDQVRYSEPLRSYMPRVDLDINFATGSWQLSPEQIDKLSVIAAGIDGAIRRDPREVFLIEGHTDAVGDDIDNLSLSDRRAEAVAVALTERFNVPPENLVTQGYGEEYLKVETEGPSQENRRVAVRRITPLIDQQTAGK